MRNHNLTLSMLERAIGELEHYSPRPNTLRLHDEAEWLQTPQYKQGQYQPRHGSVTTMGIGKRTRYCRACDGMILKGERHLTIDSHNSSGKVSNNHICLNCLIKFAEGLDNI